MQTTVKAGDKIEVLSLYGTAALRGFFIYSEPNLIDKYVTFLHKSISDESIGDIRNHIQGELNEFEVTDEEIYNYLKSNVVVNVPINA